MSTDDMTPTRSDYEAAARAAGLRIEWIEDAGAAIIVNADGTRGAWWDPIHDDGDSRRLQVAARIGIRFEGNIVFAFRGLSPWLPVVLGTDPCAAAREAVWRVAVMVGKEMKDA